MIKKLSPFFIVGFIFKFFKNEHKNQYQNAFFNKNTQNICKTKSDIINVEFTVILAFNHSVNI